MKEVKKKKAKCKIRVAQDLMHSRMTSLREKHFVTTFILQYSSKFYFFYSFLELNNYNGYVCAIYNCCFTAYL